MARLYSNRFWQIYVYVLFAIAPINSWAQIPLSNSATYTQNFDGMGSTLNLPANWRMAASTSTPTWSAAADAVTQQASSGSPTQGGTYNWGSTASERAVGAMTSTSFASPNSLLAFFQNTSNTGTITQLNVSYNAERYRTNTTAASIQFFYSLDGSTWTAVSSGDIANSEFPIGASAYSFTTPLVVSRTFSIPSLNLAQSQSFYLRWNITTGASNSQGIGIDDVNITPTFNFPSTNIPSNPGVNWVGANQGYTVPVNCNGASPFVMKYRRLATTTANPADGRGQWTTTLSAQASGGDVALQNMTGGNNNGFLFISGGNCGSNGTFANKWAFSGSGAAALNGVNNTNHFISGGEDMGLNMSTAGHYTFVLRDAGYTNSNFYVGFTQNPPVSISHSPVSQVSLNGNYSISVQAILSATPSTGERVFLRFKINNNDFGTATTSIVEGTVSGTTVTFNIPTQSVGATVNYYLFTSTLTLATLNGLSESDRSLAVLRVNDNNNANFSYTIPSPQTYIWNGGASGSWMVATNWSPNGIPGNSDAVVFNNAAAVLVTNVPSVNLRSISMSGTGSVTWQAASAATLTVGFSGASNPVLAIPTGKQFILAGTNAIIIGINSGFTAIINGRLTFTQANHRLTAQSVNGISFENGSLFEAQSGFNGNAFGSTGTNGSVVFRNGSIYEHSSGANPFGDPGVNITVFQTGSLYRYLVNTASGILALSARTYANFELGVPSSISANGSNPYSIDNLTITSTGANFTITISGNGNINGTISIAAGSTLNYSPAAAATLNLSTNPQTINTNGTGTFNVGSNGTVIVRTGSDVQLLGETIISGTGSFVVESGATLGIGSANGIAATASTGNIQTAGRTFNTGANYRYQGNTNQVTGNGLPLTVNALLISNTGATGNNTVTLTNTNTTTTRLDLNNGLFAAGTDQNLNIANGGRISGNGGGQPGNVTAGTITFLGGPSNLTSQTIGFQSGQPVLYSVIQQCGVDYNGDPNTFSATILNTLRMDAGSFVTDAPFYATGSNLVYNSGGPYYRNSEWGSLSGQGYPHHVTVQNNTTLFMWQNKPNPAPSAYAIAGNLQLGNASSWGRLTMRDESNVGTTFPLIIAGDLIIGSGTSTNSELNLSPAIGGDLILNGNFTRHNGNLFTDNIRATFLRGNNNTTISTPGVTPAANTTTQNFSFLFIDKISNAQNIILSCPVGINSRIDFSNGIMRSDAVNFLQINDGAIATGASFNSFVHGIVRKVGTQDFMFPTGFMDVSTPHFRPVGISGLSGSNTFIAEFVRGNPRVVGPISTAATAAGLSTISGCEYWNLSRLNNSNTARVTLSWSNDNRGLSNCNVATSAYVRPGNEAGLRVVPFNNSNQWGDVFGNDGMNISSSISTITWNGPSPTYTRFVLGSIDWRFNPLPFRFTSFTATGRGKQAQLDWAVNINANIVNYTIERSSDGRNFGSVFSVNSTVEAGVATYRQFDASAPAGWNYYRLRATDHQGENHFSAVQKVWLGSGSAFQMGPNPTRNVLNVTLGTGTNWRQLQITNGVGQVLLQQPALQGTRSIDLSKLPAGMYYLRLLGDGGTEVHAFVKE